MSRPVIAAGVWLGLVSAAWADMFPVPRGTAVPTVQPPTIDGVIQPEEWAGALSVAGFVEHSSGFAYGRRGQWWFMYDARHLYLAVRTELPPEGDLVSTVRRRDGKVWQDDSVEIWLDPHREPSDPDRRFFQTIVNALGVCYDVAFNRVRGNVSEVWDGAWTFASKTADGYWSLEASVSRESLADRGATLWGLNLCRDWHQPFAFSSWSQAPVFAAPERMGVVELAPAGPVVQLRSIGDPYTGQIDLKLAVRNPHAQALAVAVKLQVEPSHLPAFGEDRTLTLAPGQEQVVALARPVEPEVVHTVHVEVKAAQSDRVYFLRRFGWRRPKGPRWTVVTRTAEAVKLDIAHYPYYGKVKARLDFSCFAGRDRVSAVQFAVRPENQAKVLGQAEIRRPAFREHQAEAVIDIGPVPAGTYRVEARLAGVEAAEQTVYAETFKREVFPWEHNTIGKSTAVIPPFEPLRVEGASVRAVLRTHRMNGLGLWEQVTSEGIDLLAEPMRLEAVAAGKPLTWAVGELRFPVREPHRVVAQGSATCEAAAVETACEYDYDGFMKVSLRWTPRGSVPLDRLTLVVPLKTAEVRYFHQVSDGIRSNFAGAVPAGEGVVWDSTRAVRNDILGTFIPYAWLGGSQRGVAWCADSDRDWVLDDRQPALDLFRQGPATCLRVHLVNTPADPSQAGRTRTVVFGLQATPVKPMPADWRRWEFTGRPPGARYLTILGSCPYWGTLSSYGDVYPRHRDLTFIDELMKTWRTGTTDWDFVNRWNEGYPKDDPDYYRSRAIHAKAGFSAVRVADVVIPYTNARGATTWTPEFATFQDEWVRAAYFGRRWKPRYDDEVGTEPVESWQDFALWYFREMVRRGIGGLYFDNTYPAAKPDIVAGGAYYRPDGQLQPSLGVFSMRQYLKRVAVMHHELGTSPHTVVHMTNGLVIPALAFAQISLDWEMNYGTRDFQDRFTVDFIHAETLGRQSGMVPLVLGGIHGAQGEEMVRLTRTAFALALPHEIKFWGFVDGALYDRVQRILLGFGYGQPDCRVFNYWEPDCPVRSSVAQVLTLTLASAGKALVLAGNQGDATTVRLDLDVHALRLTRRLSAVNRETGQAVPVEGQTVVLPIGRRDFQIVEVAGQ